MAGPLYRGVQVVQPRICCPAGKLLAVDYRISCLSDEYRNYRVFTYAAIVIWPLGFPCACLGMLYYYKVPQLAAQKLRHAEEQAFLEHWTSALAKLGKPLGPIDGLELQDLTQDQLHLLLETVRSSSPDEAGPELGMGKRELVDVLTVRADAPHEGITATNRSSSPHSQLSPPSIPAPIPSEEAGVQVHASLKLRHWRFA